MPQDHASWDRKELLRQRKHERPEQSFDSPFRWRDSPSTPSHHLPREFSRWGSGDFRRPSCHGKQGGRHQFVEETSHGYTSSRSSSRMFDNDYYRPSASRGDWRYARNCREDRVSLNQKDWKCNTWEMSNGSSRGFERPCGIRNGRRSVDERPSHSSDNHAAVGNSWDPANSAHQPDIETCTPVRSLKFKSEQKFSDQRLSLSLDPHSDCVSLFERPSSENNYSNKSCSPVKQCSDLMYSRRLANGSSLDPTIPNAELEGTWEQLHLKDPQDNRLHGISAVNGARKCGKENSVGANGKLPVWTGSGSFASQSSGFSHSSSLKSLGAVDSRDRKNEILPKTVDVTQSSSGDATACATATQLTEEMISRKKQRLGWGEGLAKYEKKKVDVYPNEDGTTLLENGTEELYSLNKNIAEKSSKAAPDYGSPTTPSSVACSSSLGFAEKSSAKTAIAASDASNMCRSPSPVSSVHLERFPINIEELDSTSMERFGCLLNDLIGTDDPGSGDSSSLQLTAMNRLLAWKSDILKAVEMTESEIDLLENKHRALQLEGGRHCPVVGPRSYLCEGDGNVPMEQEASCILGPKAAAPSVAETQVNAPLHQAVSAEVPVDVFEDRPGEVKTLSQSIVIFERNEDMLPVPSMKAAASPKEINASAFANQETIEISSVDDSLPSNEDLLCAKLLSSNKKYACEASKVFDELLPRDLSASDDSRFPSICQRQLDSHVKEKITDRIQLLRAREKILLLQFKAFQLSWKKDLHQLELAKYQSKSSRKAELYPSARYSGHLKLPQPVRLRFSSSAPRRDSVVPTTELVNYMEKLLPTTHLKPLRDTLRMPAMILDEKERVMSRFISSNGLIEDPHDVEKERAMINPWTSEEKEIFLDMLATHGKNFKKIATYLTQKTTADCIDYYYKNHKSDSFGKIKKQRGKEGKHTYMSEPRKKWKREMGAASLDLLGGAVSIIAENAGKVASTRQISSKANTIRGCSSSNSLQHDGNNSEGCSYSLDLPRKRTVGADVLAVGPLSSEQINSCLRTSMSSKERSMDHLKFDPVVKKPRISHTTHNENSNEEDDSCSEESCGETGPIHWTDDERSAFIQGFSLFGKNFASISRHVGTRSQEQCRVFFSKVRKCLGLECIQFGSGHVSTSASVDNGNEGGGSDLEDPCAMESNSGIGNNGVCTKIGTNSPTTPFNMNQDGANHSGSANVKAGPGRSEQENGVVPYLCLKDGNDLVNNGYVNGGLPGLVSEACRELVDINTVETQCQAAGKSKSNDIQSMEIDEGTLTSVTVSSSEALCCGPSVLSNVIVETSTESSRKGSGGGQSAAMPKQSSKNQDGVMTQAANRSRSSGLKAETAVSGFKYPECLHHVPIAVSTDDPVGVRGNPNCHTVSESPNSLVGQVVETHNLAWQSSSKVNLDLDRRPRVLSHVNPEQNGQVNATNPESCQIPHQRSFTQDATRISRSKSDLIVKTFRTGEGFSLNKCSTSSSSAAKPVAIVSHKDGGRSGHHSRSHSLSLSDDTERLDKNGNVKLFGTVLTADENGSSRQKHNPNGIVRSSSSTLSSRDHDSRNQYINQQQLQNVPITSYGFWDGSRIQTGLTSLPESAKLLASCPEAFSSHLMQQVGNNSNGVLSFGKHNNEDRAEASNGKEEGNIAGI